MRQLLLAHQENLEIIAGLDCVKPAVICTMSPDDSQLREAALGFLYDLARYVDFEKFPNQTDAFRDKFTEDALKRCKAACESGDSEDRAARREEGALCDA